MIHTGTERPHRPAMYCRETGRRLAPRRGLEAKFDDPTAVAVFDTGETVSVFDDTVLGRAPDLDDRVLAGRAARIVVDDPTNRISRSHMLLRANKFQLEVIDLGSINGTAVSIDGQWETLTPGIAFSLDDGQQIRLAQRTVTIFHFRR